MRLRNEIFAQAYHWMRQNKKVRSQKHLAALMGVSEDTITRIMKDQTSVTEDIIVKLNHAAENVFYVGWLRGDDPYHMLLKDYLDSLDDRRIAQSAVPNHDYADVPAWADSIIQLVSDSIAEAEALRRENQQLRAALSSVIEDNKLIRADLGEILQRVRGIYTSNIDTTIIPIAAEHNPNKS